MFVIDGNVKMNFVTGSEENPEVCLYIKISQEYAERIRENCKINEDMDNPIKADDEGELVFKCASKYPVKVYDSDGELSDISATTIGTGSRVSVAFTVKDGKYKNRKYQAAYLRSVQIHDLMDREDYNPFTDDNARI